MDTAQQDALEIHSSILTTSSKLATPEICDQDSAHTLRLPRFGVKSWKGCRWRNGLQHGAQVKQSV